MSSKATNQLYTLYTSDLFIESNTDIACRADSVGEILNDPAFIKRHGYRFEYNLSSFELQPSETHKGCIEVIINYIDICGVSKNTSFFLRPKATYMYAYAPTVNSLGQQEETTDFIVLSNRNELLGYSALSICDRYIEVLTVVARPSFGRLLYQGLARFAYLHNKFLISDRDGNTRPGALNVWDQLHTEVPSGYMVQLPDELNATIQEELSAYRAAPCCYGYSIPASESFLNNLISIDKNPEKVHLRRLIRQGKDWWNGCCGDGDDNHWINEAYPLHDHTPAKSEPIHFGLP